MDRSTVALVRCNDYDPAAVYGALRRGLELLGGADHFARPGEHILLKPNILAGDSPEKAVTTHPAVLAGCARLFREAGARVIFGDSPGRESAAHAARASGLEEAGLRSGATLGDFSAGQPLSNPRGSLVSGFPIVRAAHQCDGIINLPKMKTHQLTRITGAVKNLFGCIPGARKALYHVQFQDVMTFSRFLVELSLCLKPRLHVMDGIVAMEGNGPRGGDPRAMGILILSDDPVAVDATFSRLVALQPTFVPTTVAGQRVGLGRHPKEEIELVGDPIDTFLQPDFRLIRKPVYSNGSYAYFNFIKDLVLSRPVIEVEDCTGCGRCVKACPVPGKALRLENSHGTPRPVYDYKRCIRCYCCLEMCPNRAIQSRTPLLGRVLQVG